MLIPPPAPDAELAFDNPTLVVDVSSRLAPQQVTDLKPITRAAGSGISERTHSARALISARIPGIGGDWSCGYQVAPVTAITPGARRAGQGRAAAKRTLDAPKRSRKIDRRSDDWISLE